MIAPLLFLLVGMLSAASSNNIQARRHAVRQLAKEVAAERNELQLEVEKNLKKIKKKKVRERVEAFKIFQNHEFSVCGAAREDFLDQKQPLKF